MTDYMNSQVIPPKQVASPTAVPGAPHLQVNRP